MPVLRRGVVPLALAVAVGCACLSACGQSAQRSVDPFAYDASRPLDVQSTALGRRGAVTLEAITYTTADGQRVPALFARPPRPVACLIYQGPLGSTKEQAAPIWTGAAKLGLATFTIDVRGSGARVSGSPPPEEVLHNADRVRRFLIETVIDLRRGLDYLETRPECGRRIGFLGSSQGGLLGALLAGDDSRIRSAVLTSITATWHGSLAAGHSLVLPGIAAHPAQLRAAVNVLAPFDAARWVARIAPRPVMLVHGLDDPLAPLPLALELDAAAREPKVALYYRGGHLPFQGPQGKSVAKRVGGFLRRTLGTGAS